MLRNRSTISNIISLISFLLVFSTSAFAADFIVTNADDTGAGSLRQAISDANGNSESDNITFDASLSGQTITLTSGELVISSDMTITGLGQDNLAISGNNASRVIRISTGTTTISQIAITDGLVTGVSNAFGGGIHVGGDFFNAGASLNLLNSMVFGNNINIGSGNAFGAGIYIDQSSTSNITNSIISDNSINTGSGNAFGAGIYIEGNITSSIANSTISGNSILGSPSNASGGGVHISGSLSLSNITVSGNSLAGTFGNAFGAGIHVDGDSTSNITNSTISGNSISGSSSNAFGAGINIDGSLNLLNSTVSENSNTASAFNVFGGGISFESFFGGELTLASTIIANNSAEDGPDVYVGFFSTITASNNLIENASDHSVSNGVNGNIVGVDPMLGPLQNNGGLTETHALLAGSPAINFGSNPNTLTTDQRSIGFDRVYGTAIDIGSYELITEQEIALIGNSLLIVNGDSIADTADDTDFGDTGVGGVASLRTFIILNAGLLDLNLTGEPLVELSGANASDFTVILNPTTPVVSNGGMTSFTIAFEPSAIGERIATVSIANNDSDENPYTFAIKGNGFLPPAPEIDVLGNEISITNLDGTPSVADDTDFGDATIGVDTITKTYTIENTGVLALNLSGAPIVSITDSFDFEVITQPSAIINAGESSTFTVEFSPSTVGIRTATVRIANNDVDENPYLFGIQANGLSGVDTDGDGVPDVNDTDDDNDGVSDTQELADGTDSRDSGSFIERLNLTFCSEWNGYLNMFNINEYVNSSSSELNFNVTLFDQDGMAKSTTESSVLAFAQQDLLVHALSGFENNAYGKTCTEIVDGNVGDIDGRTMLYHPEFDFVLSLPFFGGKLGSQFVQFNTYHPQPGSSNFVSNWVSVSNEESTAQSGEAIFYSQTGAELGRQVATIDSQARFDFSAHQFGARQVGLVEWRPTNTHSAKFVVRNVRYYYDNDGSQLSFDSAVQVLAVKGISRDIVVPLDRTEGYAVLELSNTGSTISFPSVFIRDVDGNGISNTPIALQPNATTHIVIDSNSLPTTMGSAKISGSNLIVSALTYTVDSANSFLNAYAVPAKEASSDAYKSSYNTYLGQGCDLIILNTSENEVESVLSATRSDGTVIINAGVLNTPANGVTNFNLCSNETANQYGSVEVSTAARGVISGYVLRKGAGNKYKVATELTAK